MNAPAKIAPSRDRYIPIVKQHRPVCEGKELELRCSMLFVRDQAAASMNRCSEDAYGVLAEIHRLASLYAYATLPITELAELRRQLVQMTCCASGLERFAYRLAYPDGGTNEGG